MNAQPIVPRLPVGANRPSLTDIISREKRRTTRRKIAWLAAVAIAVGAVAVAAYALRPRPAPLAARFRAQPAAVGALVREVRATGHVEAVTTVSVGAEISGRIESVEVDYNAKVKKGQLLARFDRTALAAQKAQLEATLAASTAQREQARFDLEQARRLQARADLLFGKEMISPQEHDSAVTTTNIASARVSAAEAQVNAQTAALQVARTSLEHAEVRSPIDGVIITRNIEPGTTVASMLQTPVLFTVAADLRLMEVVAAVDESDIGEVRTGQTASFSVNAFPERVFTGRVTEVRNSPVMVQDVVTYGAVVEVDNPDLALRPGMTASVRVRTAAVDDALKVPNAALHFTPPGAHRDEGGDSVFVLGAAGPVAVPVRAGVSDGEWTQVEGSLKRGDAVLVDLTPAGKKAYGVGAPN